jgi:DNA-binding HxlR family transcriptional regulator
MSAPGEPHSVPDLLELVSHAHVLEILDALTRGPMTLADLSTHVRAGQRGLAVALRLVGARGLVARNDSGSWDSEPPAEAVYRHTDLGLVVVEALSCYSLWTAMYDRTDAAADHSWNR